jgi:hypothetical protein
MLSHLMAEKPKGKQACAEGTCVTEREKVSSLLYNKTLSCDNQSSPMRVKTHTHNKSISPLKGPSTAQH